MIMGKIRRMIADFIRSRRVDDKRHPRFLAGYLAGMHDAKLEAETTHEDGIVRLEKWPEGHVLWYHGGIVWRSWLKEEAQSLPPALPVGRSQKTVAVDREVLGDIAQLLSGSMFTFISTEERARERGSELYALLATTEGSADGR